MTKKRNLQRVFALLMVIGVAQALTSRVQAQESETAETNPSGENVVLQWNRVL